MTPFQEPRKIAPVALIYVFGRTLRTILSQFWPFLIAIVFQWSRRDDPDEGNSYLTYVFIAFLIMPVASGLIRYFTFRWRLTGDALVIRYGLVKIVELRIPFERVQAIDLQEPWYYRPFGAVRFVIDTAGAKSKEGEIWALEPEVAEELRAYILARKFAESDIPADPVRKELKTHVSMTLGDLLRIGLFRNHFKSIAAFIGGGFYLWSQLQEVFDDPEINGALSTAYNLLPRALSIGILLGFLVILAAMVYSVISTTVRYFGFRITEEGDVLRASYGMFSRKTRQLRPEKVQIMRTERGPVYQKLGLTRFRIEQAYSGKESGKEDFSIPGGPTHMVAGLRERLFGKIPETVHPGTSRLWIPFRAVRLGLLPMVLLIPIYFFPEFHNALWFGLYFPFQIGYSYLLWRGQALGLNDQNLVVQRRVWFLKTSTIALEKVQAVEISTSWYQRTHGLVTVNIETAGGSVSVPFLPEKTGLELANYLLYKSETSVRSWM